MSSHNLTNRFTLMAVKGGLASGSVRRTDLEVETEEKHGVKTSDRIIVRLEAYNNVPLRRARQSAATAKTFLKDNSVHWEDKSWRLVPNEDVQLIKDKFSEIRMEAKAIYEDEFLATYEDWVRNDSANLGSAFNADDYPSLEELRGRFMLELEVDVVPSPEDDVRAGWPEDIQELYLETAGAKHRENMKRAVDSLISSCRSTLEHFQDRMEKYDGTRNGSFKGDIVAGLLDVGKMLSSFNVTEDPRLDEICEEITELANANTTQELRDSYEARASSEEAVKGILSKVGDFRDDTIDTIESGKNKAEKMEMEELF